MNALLVLGVDPGLETAGFAVVRAGRPPRLLDSGTISSGPRTRSLEERLLELHRGIHEVLGAWSPGAMAMEEVFVRGAFPATAIQLGQARGVLALAAAQAGIRLSGYEPARVKLQLAGNGQAGKEDVQRAIRARLVAQVLPRSDHATDAIAVALCHLEAAGARRLAGIAAGGRR